MMTAKPKRARWGLWHRGRKKWCRRFGVRAEYETFKAAFAAKVSHTAGKRDPGTNYWRRFVSVRKIPILALMAGCALAAEPPPTLPPMPAAPVDIPIPPGTIVPAFDSSVMLAWNTNLAANIAGYRVYWGDVSIFYTQRVDVGNLTFATIGGLQPATRYFFAATDYDTNAFESDFSAEVSYLVPPPPPPPAPTNYLISVSIEQSGDMTNWLSTIDLPALVVTNSGGAGLFFRAHLQILPQ